MIQIERKACQAIRAYGSVDAALKDDRLHQNLRAQLNRMILHKPEDFLKVRVGARLRVPGTRERFVMTTLNFIVNIDSGHMLDARNAPLPLEIYKYGGC
jgi:hypothetical protein